MRAAAYVVDDVLELGAHVAVDLRKLDREILTLGPVGDDREVVARLQRSLEELRSLHDLGLS